VSKLRTIYTEERTKISFVVRVSERERGDKARIRAANIFSLSELCACGTVNQPNKEILV